MYTLAPDIALVETDYGMVLLDQVRGQYWNLNPSGVLVLRAALASGELAGAVSALMEEFPVDQAVAETDARLVVDELTAAGILVQGGAA